MNGGNNKQLNMKKLIILLIVLLLCPILSFGQTNTITLVASGDGATKTEAESMALRSAIEQAFGTFVSANTTILNDDIVKDEIATISSGNIESYSIVAESETGGRWHVTVKAVVSINKLIDYAKSHGSSTEFAGQNFAMQMKMRKLNKENEEKALSDLLSEVERITSNVYCFDYEIEQGEPLYSSDSKYTVQITVTAKCNQNTENIKKMILSTFESLALTESEQVSYTQNLFPMTRFQPLEISFDNHSSFWMRSDEEFLVQFAQSINNCLLKNLNSFYIVRNGGGEQFKKIQMPAQGPEEKITRENVFFINLVMSEDLLFQTEGFAVKPDFGVINELSQGTKNVVSNSNVNEDEDTEPIPFTLVDEKPKFNGGDTSLFGQWIKERVKNSQISEKTGQSGRVMVQITINTHGYVTNVKILRGISSSVDNMVLGIVSGSPIWEPGRLRGQAVSVSYTFPVIVN